MLSPPLLSVLSYNYIYHSSLMEFFNSLLAETLSLPEISMTTTHRIRDDKLVEVPFIPSLIHFGENHQVWIGKQVHDRGKNEVPSTFRWMKWYISNRLDLPREVNGRRITFPQAGAEFLGLVLDYVSSAIGLDDEEIAFTVPVESYEHYQEWLSQVCDTAGIRRYRLLDEASAAALGYGVSIQANDVYMVFDFGGGTLDVSIVRIEGEVVGGKRCRVLGKKGCDIGGTNIDKWLYQDLLKKCHKQPEDVRHLSAILLNEVELAKLRLTKSDYAEVTVVDPRTGAVIGHRYSRTEYEDLLEDHGLFASIQSTVDYALTEARERGFGRDHIKSVLLVGGSSLIPSVRRAMRQMFGERVQYHKPMDAVSLGGAAFVGGVDFYDHIQHDYALRFYNREKKDYDFLVIVSAGTPYPSVECLKEITVKASYDDQEYLGLDIYEIGQNERYNSESNVILDLVFDSSGAARFQESKSAEIRNRFWVNEKCPTFIHAEPRAMKGDPRFRVQFTIDGNKRLCVTVQENKSGKILMRNHPLIKLT